MTIVRFLDRCFSLQLSVINCTCKVLHYCKSIWCPILPNQKRICYNVTDTIKHPFRKCPDPCETQAKKLYLSNHKTIYEIQLYACNIVPTIYHVKVLLDFHRLATFHCWKSKFLYWVWVGQTGTRLPYLNRALNISLGNLSTRYRTDYGRSFHSGPCAHSRRYYHSHHSLNIRSCQRNPFLTRWNTASKFRYQHLHLQKQNVLQRNARCFTFSAPCSVNILHPEEYVVPTITVMRRTLEETGHVVAEGHTCLHICCPFCQEVKGQESSAQENSEETIYVNMVSGYSICQCRKVNGSWESLKEPLTIAYSTDVDKRSEVINTMIVDLKEKDEASEEKWRETQAVWEMATSIEKVPVERLSAVKKRFGIQEITDETLSKFGVRAGKRLFTELLLPQYDRQGQLTGFNTITGQRSKRPSAVRRLGKQNLPRVGISSANSDPEKRDRGNIERDHVSDEMGADGDDPEYVGDEGQRYKTTHHPKGSPYGLFGFHLIDPQQTELIVTSSELDAMALYQRTNVAVLAVPRGINCLPLEVLPLFEQFEKITLWFDNDMQSWEAVRQFAKKLGSSRCFLVKPLDKQPSPLKALKRELTAKTILRSAIPVSHKFIVTFSSVRDQVLSELRHADQVAGVRWKRFPAINKILKGFRQGELTIFTGPTGSGKTTFMSEYSLDLCMQGVSTLWGSFEIHNHRLAKVMLYQYSRVNLEKNLQLFHMYADKFEELPLFFMAFHGAQNLKNVLEVMSHAVYVHDIKHIILDNLQFMSGGTMKQSMMEKFSTYDNAIGALRTFCTENNCHVTVVIHPRKEKETEELMTSSIFGSAKASQEADNVLILQDCRFIEPPRKSFVQITKNRFGGDLGKFPIHFNKETLTMSPVKKSKQKKPTVEQDQGLPSGNEDPYKYFEKMFDDDNINIEPPEGD